MGLSGTGPGGLQAIQYEGGWNLWGAGCVGVGGCLRGDLVRVILALAATGLLALVPGQDGSAKVRVGDGPTYTADGQLRLPGQYREWVFLASGLDMSYDPKPTPMGAGMFNNVFVNPAAYKAYQATGHWPEGTELVLENRGAEAARSINKAGRTQSAELMGLEVHVLDSGHVEAKAGAAKGDGWAFYSFDNPVSAKEIARPASCYTCHEQHAAVDTTFVQFYPTLEDAARKHKSFSAAYLKELAAK
jgi:hypothetical protein